METPLFTDQVREVEALEKAHGLTPSPTEIFNAQHNIVLRSGDSTLQATATALADRFNRATTQDEQQQILNEMDALVEAARRQTLGEQNFASLTTTSPIRSVGRTARARGAFNRYSHQFQLEDIPQLERWKADVERIKSNIRDLYNNPSANPSDLAMLKDRLGETPTDPHLTRLAISLFIINTKNRWRFIPTLSRALFRMIVPTERALENFGKQRDFCADEALTGKVLADAYNERTDIVSESTPFNRSVVDFFRHFFQMRLKEKLTQIIDSVLFSHQSLRFEDGAVIDSTYLMNLGGYARTPQEFEEALQEGTDHVVRRAWESLARTLK